MVFFTGSERIAKNAFALAASMLVILIASAGPALAQEAAEGPQEVGVGLYVLNLGRFDVTTGAFNADFYLSLKCSGVCPPGIPDNFEFMNGRASSIDKIIDEPGEKFYRIQASLNSPVDLIKFPFDSQRMQIIIEDKAATSEELVYVPDNEESGIDDSIFFTGWDIDGWSAGAREHEYGVYDESYSQYVFSVDISRIAISSFMKTFLPVFFILVVVVFSFVLDPDKVITRITVNGSSLIAAVLFHVAIGNQIPPVGYLTFADKFMILTYLILLASFLINVLIIEFQEKGNKKMVEKVHRSTEYTIFWVVPLLYAILFLFFI
jgi:hypothetical protein